MITAEYAKSLLQSTTTWLVLSALLFILFAVIRLSKRKKRYPSFLDFQRKRRRQAKLRKVLYHALKITSLRSYYVWLIVVTAGGLLACAIVLYLYEIALSVTGMVDLLGKLVLAANNTEATSSGDEYTNLRNVGYATAALLGVLAASATLFFSLIRVWTNERTTRATEEGLITDRINKAVEGLGTDKTVKQPRVDSDGAQIHILDDSGDPDLTRPVYDEKTEPNIEVRVGAILSLERIAEDSERDHISIMEILCAYIRQNAAGPDMPMPPDLQGPITERWQLHLGWEAWQAWAAQFRSAPRLDLDVAHRVVSKRPQRRIRHEEVLDRRLNLQNVDLSGLVLQDSDLTRADLRSAELQGTDLRDAELQGAVLRGAELQGADLTDAELQGAVLRGAKLQGAVLRGAELQGADLTDAELQGAVLRGAKLQGAVLRGAELQGADLRGAELQGADLGRAKLQGADLGRAKLQGADLRGAELQGADLERAELQGADLGFAELQGAVLRGAELQGADLGFAKLPGADLGFAELQGAVLRGAELQGADLGFAKLPGADLGFAELQGAVLRGAELQGADLGRAKLQGADLGFAKFDATTDLISATLRAALIRSVDFTDVPQFTPHLKEAFFDGSVTLPGGITSDMDGWPADRPREELEDNYGDESSPLFVAWRAWQREHHPDTLPEHLR